VKKITSIIIYITELIFLFGCKNTQDEKYTLAIDFYLAGQYSEAYSIFEELGDYKDSNKYIIELDEIFISTPTSETAEPTESQPTPTISPDAVLTEFVLSQFDYYIPERFERYIEFSLKNPDFSVEDIILKVNMNLDYDFYEQILPITDPNDRLVLCNKYYQLPANFVPSNLVEVPAKYHKNDGRTYLLNETALNAFYEMAEAAKTDGIELRIFSAYRSFSFQELVYQNYVETDGIKAADRYSSRPGHSEHQAGLAVDLNLISQSFENQPEFFWLRDNSYKFGYILRYTKGHEHETGYTFEPWHYRFVGKDIALKIFEEDITFDLYYAKYILPFE